MNRKLLITGASGFVGYHLITEALHQGYDVYAAVRESSSVAHLAHLPIRFTYPDFGNVHELRKELDEKEYAYIIHAAGITKARTQKEYDLVNAVYTRNLAQAIVSSGRPSKKLVFLSSLAASGPATLSQPVEEISKPSPVTPYGKSKLMAEQYLNNTYGLDFITLKPTAVYGPREKDLLLMFRSIGRGLEPYIGNQDQHLSFIYVKDLARAAVNALQSNRSRKSYLLSDGMVYDKYAMGEVVKALLQKKTIRLHIPIPVVRLVARVLDTAYAFSSKTPTINREKLPELMAESWACSIEKARTELDFEPQYDLKKGLAETIRWYKNNNWL
jgi:nucleoside-diphosphate-sugar epimerase